MDKLGKLERVNLRKVWPHEEHNFSAWLSQEEGLKTLSDAIGVDDIVLEEREASVGKYRADIYGKEENSDRKVIIENQLTETNHEHLGKIITYASGKDARIIIWIAARARDEHRQAIAWLNAHTDENVDFFLLEIELWKIGDSLNAPKFNIVSKPNDWGKIQRLSDNLSPAQKLQGEFWQAFGEYGANNEAFSKEFSKKKPLPQHWYNLSAGGNGYHIALICSTKNNEVALEVNIHNNKDIYDIFYDNKNLLEERTGLTFQWRRSDDKISSQIRATKKCDTKNRAEWDKAFEWFCEKALVVKKEFNEVYNHSGYSV